MAILVYRVKRMMHPFFLLMFILPIAAVIAFGTFYEKQIEDLVIPIGIVDEDRTGYSKKIVAQMKKEKLIKVKEVSRDEAESLLSRNEADSIFVIKEQFEQNLLDENREETIELWTSPTSAASGVVREVMASEVTKITSAIKASNRVEKLYEQKVNDDSAFLKKAWDDAHDYAIKQWEPEPLMTIRYIQGNTIDSGADKKDGASLFAPYIGIWSFVTMLSCFITSDWIVKERTSLFARISTTEKGLSAYLIQNTGAYIVFHILQAIASYSIMNSLGLIDSTYWLLASMILYILCVTALSIWIASWMRHLGSFYVIGMLISFIAAIVGGSFFPLAELASSLQVLSDWSIQRILFLTALSMPAPFADKWPVASFMLVSALFLWSWTIWRLKVK